METYLFVAFEAEILLLLPFAGADLKAIVYVSGAQNVMQKEQQLTIIEMRHDTLPF